MNSSLFISHSQIAFFNGKLVNPFNNWTRQHVAQGFSWRKESVSFGTLVDGGRIDVEFINAGEFRPTGGAVRVISVPFLCLESSSLEIASIVESIPVKLNPGDYQLIYETGWHGDQCWCRFTAIIDGDMSPQLLLIDPALNPSYPLLMSAEPA